MTQAKPELPRWLGQSEYAPLTSYLAALADAYRGGDFASYQQFASDIDALSACPDAQLQAWCEAEPHSPWASLLRGRAHIDAAEALRGSGTVDQVSRKQWEAIEVQFDLGQTLLEQAINQGAPAGAAYSALMSRQQIMGSRTQAERYFALSMERDPLFLESWNRLLGIREQRWGGSIADMDSLMRLARERLPQDWLIELTGRYYWWRCNYTRTWEGNPNGALQLVDEGLAACATSLTRRAILLEEKFQALNALERQDEALGVARESLALKFNADLAIELAKLYEAQNRLSEALGILEHGAALPGAEGYACARWLAYSYRDGDGGLSVDEGAALRLFERAYTVAETDETAAESALHIANIFHARGNAQDDLQAVHWVRQAMARHSADAATRLAKWVAAGRAQLAADESLAGLHRFAAEQGDANAALRYALALEQEGQPEQARFWLERAADLGNATACSRLAQRALQRGQTDLGERLLWLAAADATAAPAIAALGVGLSEGWFGEPRHDEAIAILATQAQHHADLNARLSLLVSRWQRYGYNTWGEAKQVLQYARKINRDIKRGELAASATQSEELGSLTRQLPGGYLSWRIRRILGKLPQLHRHLSPQQYLWEY